MFDFLWLIWVIFIVDSFGPGEILKKGHTETGNPARRCRLLFYLLEVLKFFYLKYGGKKAVKLENKYKTCYTALRPRLSTCIVF